MMIDTCAAGFPSGLSLERYLKSMSLLEYSQTILSLFIYVSDWGLYIYGMRSIDKIFVLSVAEIIH